MPLPVLTAMSYIAEWSSNCAAIWYTFTLRQTLRNSMCTGVKVSWALSSSDGARERKMNPDEPRRKVAPPQNHGGRKTEAKQRHYKTVVLPSFFCLHLHAPPTVPVQPPVFLVIPKVPAYPAVSPGPSGEVSGFGAWRPGPDRWLTGRSFCTRQSWARRLSSPAAHQRPDRRWGWGKAWESWKAKVGWGD